MTLGVMLYFGSALCLNKPLSITSFVDYLPDIAPSSVRIDRAVSSQICEITNYLQTNLQGFIEITQRGRSREFSRRSHVYSSMHPKTIQVCRMGMPEAMEWRIRNGSSGGAELSGPANRHLGGSTQ
jgi:hypothetical protein